MSVKQAQMTASVRGARVQDDRVLPLVRIVALGVIVVLILAVGVLYFMPDQTDRYFAWTINPPLTAMAMGAGYLMGIYFFARVALSRHWHTLGLGFLPISAFTIWMLLATLLHSDRFHQGTIAFFLWTGIYILTPILVPTLWYLNRNADPRTPAPDDLILSRTLRIAVGLTGGLFVIASITCFLFPDLLIRIYPWKLTPLTARVVAGWLSFPAIGGILLAREVRWSSWKLVLEAALVGLLAFALALPRDWNDLVQSNPLSWIMLLGIVGSLIFVPAFWLYMERKRAAVSPAASRLEARR